MRTGIITVPKAVLRSGIGQSTTDELLSGWTVCILEEKDGWVSVMTHYGYQGWTEKRNLTELSKCSLFHRQNAEPAAVLCRPAADVLKEPRVQSQILQTLFMGSIVTLPASQNLPKNKCQGSQTGDSSTENGYQKIQTADGCIGYVPAISLAPRKDRDCFEDCCCVSPSFLSHQARDIPDVCNFRSRVLSCACSFLGAQYRWGGKTIEGIDCSGLAFMSYFMCGILIYRDAVIRDGYPVHEIPFSQIQPADLLYFPGHVALYLGNEKYIHATANAGSFGCGINSFSPNDCDYRADLAQNLTAAGSVF